MLPQLLLLAMLFFSQVCSPKDLRSGYFSQYGQSPTDGTIHYHQNKSGKLPQDMSQYVGVIAVKDCGLVGDDAWIRFTDDRIEDEYAGLWLPVKIFDCSGHVETTEWMNENNIIGELGYYLANDLNIYGQTQIFGEMILVAPASVERICEPEETTPIPVYVPVGTPTVPQLLTAESEISEISSATPTATTPPTAAIVWRTIANTTRTAMMSATPTPGTTMVQAPLARSQVKTVTVFDAIENLPLVLAGLAFGLWLGFGLLMFLFGRMSSRSAGKVDHTLYQDRDSILTSAQAREMVSLLRILQKQYPGLLDDET